MAERKRFTKSYKQEVAKRLAAGESVSSLSKESGVPESTIRGWRNIDIEQDDVLDSSTYGKVEAEELRYKILKEENNARILAIVDQLLHKVSR